MAGSLTLPRTRAARKPQMPPAGTVSAVKASGGVPMYGHSVLRARVQRVGPLPPGTPTRRGGLVPLTPPLPPPRPRPTSRSSVPSVPAGIVCAYGHSPRTRSSALCYPYHTPSAKKVLARRRPLEVGTLQPLGTTHHLTATERPSNAIVPTSARLFGHIRLSCDHTSPQSHASIS